MFTIPDTDVVPKTQNGAATRSQTARASEKAQGPQNPSDPANSGPAKAVQPPHWLGWSLVGCLVVAYAALSWQRRWMSDDGYINVRIVQQLFAGNGPVFNAGERVEAATSTLWLYLVAGLAFLTRAEISLVAVVTGCALAVTALILAALGCHRLHRAAGTPTGVAIPVGLLIVCAIPQFADFATSGLENALAFAWLAGSFCALAVKAGERTPASRPAWMPILIGLGVLIRPDLTLYVAFLLVALLALSERRWLAYTLALLLAGAVPVAYQIFRMGYYATLVPNTALAKDASGSQWGFGLRYVSEFLGAYALVIPLLVVAALYVVRIRRLVRERAWRVLVVIASFLAPAALHLLYTVRVGGDFMFGRFLLTPLFALLLPLAVCFASGAAVTRGLGIAVSILLAWSLVPATHVDTFKFRGAGVQDEREIYQGYVPSGRTVAPWDWTGFSFYEAGHTWAADAAAGRTYFREDREYPVAPGYSIVATHNAMGIVSVAAGTRVAVIDNLALTDPIAARMPAAKSPMERVGHRGHPKEWRIARYSMPLPQEDEPIRVAREVLRCEPVAKLQHAIGAPMTGPLFLDNVVRSVEYTRLHIPRSPVKAKQKLCG